MSKTVQDAVLAGCVDELAQLSQAVERFPNQVNAATEELKVAVEAASKVTGTLHASAQEAVRLASAQTEERLACVVAASAESIAKTTARRDLVKWMLGGVGGGVLVLVVFGWLMLSMGREVGYTAGVADTQRSAEYQQAAFAWSKTPEGELALAFSALGELRALALCEKPGWVVEVSKDGSRFCFPRSVGKEKVSGWQLPLKKVDPSKAQAPANQASAD